MKKELLIKRCLDQHESIIDEYNKKHEEFIKRISAMYDWWDEEGIVIKEGFVGSKAYIKGKESICVYANIAFTPYFILEFRFVPYFSEDNIGDGETKGAIINF
jgi:hypothetical protein